MSSIISFKDFVNETKTSGIALSAAYKDDFDGKKPQSKSKPKDEEPVALSAAYSTTGKPGGKLIKSKD